MSRTPYFSGPVVWMDSCSSVLLYSHDTPFSITTRDSGSSSSLLRKRWPVSWFFTAGAGNNKGFHKMASYTSSCTKTPPPSSYLGYEESLWTPGSAGVGLLWGSPGSSGNLYNTIIIWLEYVSVEHRTSGSSSISSGQMLFWDLVSWCCGWSFLWWSYSWSYLLHRHHIDPPAGLKRSAHHNLHAAWGDRKQGEMRGNQERSRS